MHPVCRRGCAARPALQARGAGKGTFEPCGLSHQRDLDRIAFMREGFFSWYGKFGCRSECLCSRCIAARFSSSCCSQHLSVRRPQRGLWVLVGRKYHFPVYVDLQHVMLHSSWHHVAAPTSSGDMACRHGCWQYQEGMFSRLPADAADILGRRIQGAAHKLHTICSDFCIAGVPLRGALLLLPAAPRMQLCTCVQ